MAVGRTIRGTAGEDLINGRSNDDTIFGGDGDDAIFGRGGNDLLFGEKGFDNLYGEGGTDVLRGGEQNDNLYGGAGADILHGDGGPGRAKGSDFGSDNLNGGRGADVLYQSDGNDTMTGGNGADIFLFKWQDPMIALAAMTGRAFTNITDFDPEADTLVFDVAGLGRDTRDANFVDGGDGTAGGAASSFFKGDAADSNGESVMVLTDTGFATGIDAVTAAQEEELGDLVVYFNTTVGVASLLFVDALDDAHSIARFANVASLAALRSTDFSAEDFLFA